MDIGTHILTGIIITYFLSDFNSGMWMLIIIFSLLPDLIGETLYQIGRIAKGKGIKLIYDEEVTNSSTYLGNSLFLFPYNFLHSIFAIIFLILLSIPNILILAYTSHLILDIISHSKKSWGIMIFWPLSKTRFGPNSNWWEWKFLKNKNILYFNLFTYSITLVLILIY